MTTKLKITFYARKENANAIAKMDVSIQGLVLVTKIIVDWGCVLIKEMLRLRNFKWKIININSRIGNRLISLHLNNKELYSCKPGVQIIWIPISLLTSAVMNVSVIKIYVWIIWFKVKKNISGYFVYKKSISRIKFYKKEIGENKNNIWKHHNLKSLKLNWMCN